MKIVWKYLQTTLKLSINLLSCEYTYTLMCSQILKLKMLYSSIDLNEHVRYRSILKCMLVIA